MVCDVEVGKTPLSASVKVIGRLRKAVGEFPPIGRGVIQRTPVGVIELELTPKTSVYICMKHLTLIKVRTADPA